MRFKVVILSQRIFHNRNKWAVCTAEMKLRIRVESAAFVLVYFKISWSHNDENRNSIRFIQVV